MKKPVGRPRAKERGAKATRPVGRPRKPRPDVVECVDIVEYDLMEDPQLGKPQTTEQLEKLPRYTSRMPGQYKDEASRTVCEQGFTEKSCDTQDVRR